MDVKIAKADWAAFCGWVSGNLAGARVEVDILSSQIGPQVQASSAVLLGLSYDHKDDVIEVALEGLDHLIRKPRELDASEDGKGLLSIQVTDEDGLRQIVKFKRTLSLPAPIAAVAPPWRREPAKSRVGRDTG